MLKMAFFAFAILALGLFVLGPGLAYARVVPPLIGFGLFALGGLLSVIVVVIGAIVVIVGGPKWAAAAALVCIPPVAIVGYLVNDARKSPPINDISTELVYPPEFEHAKTLPENAGRDMALPERFKDIIRQRYKDVQPLPVLAPLDEAYVKAYELAKSQPGWTITNQTIGEKEARFEGVAESSIFHFKDDFVVRVTQAGDVGCVVDMRSKSRDGRGDLGANAKRIKDFFALLQKELPTAPPIAPKPAGA